MKRRSITLFVMIACFFMSLHKTSATVLEIEITYTWYTQQYVLSMM